MKVDLRFLGRSRQCKNFLTAPPRRTGEFGPPAVVKAGLLAKWKGKMVIGRKLGAGAFGTASAISSVSQCTQ